MRSLIIFDLDGTLVHNYASLAWRQYLIENQLTNSRSYEARNKKLQEKFEDGTIGFQEDLAFSLLPIIDMPAEEAKVAMYECGRTCLAPWVLDDAKQVVRDMVAQRGGDDIIVISGFIEYIVEGFAHALGIKHAIGSRFVVRNRYIQPDFDGVPSFGEGKLQRVKEWLADHHRDEGYYDQVVCYANSIYDVPLLEFADVAYAVNPSQQLLPIAEARNWPILYWSDSAELDLSESSLQAWNSPVPTVMHRKLTVFDLDDTLINGDTSVIWREYLQEKGLISDPDFAQKDLEFQRQYAEGTLNLTEYIAFSLTPVADIPAEILERKVRDCVRTCVMPQIFNEAKSLIKTLNEAGEDMMIISATASLIVKAVAEELGIKDAIGVDLAKDDGYYTANVVGIPSFQAGKVQRLKQWLIRHNRYHAYYDNIVFYTDSINDLPLCEFASTVYTVNPCERLRPIAEERGWHILSWGS
ncbi:MAG: HAD-IB family hydrolase [Gammaproteobacteria bacterium]|nr:MAG: HAD-IB family hydrolase [Gammaproteobacteria bacterium]